MLKLFKYNWKMNSMGLYITLTATALLYALLLIGKYRYGWVDDILLGFGFMIATFSQVIFYIMSAMIFNHGLKSYHRRLIPIKPIQEIVSMTLLAVVYSVAGALLALLFFMIADFQFVYEEVNEVLRAFYEPGAIAILLILIIWNAITLISILMLAISTSYCFRGKYRAWLGIIVFFTLPIITELIMHWVIGDTANNYFAFIKLEMDNSGDINSAFELTNIVDFLSIPALIDVIGVALQLAVTNYLMKKHIQL